MIRVYKNIFEIDNKIYYKGNNYLNYFKQFEDKTFRLPVVIKNLKNNKLKYHLFLKQLLYYDFKICNTGSLVIINFNQKYDEFIISSTKLIIEKYEFMFPMFNWYISNDDSFIPILHNMEIKIIIKNDNFKINVKI